MIFLLVCFQVPSLLFSGKGQKKVIGLSLPDLWECRTRVP